MPGWKALRVPLWLSGFVLRTPGARTWNAQVRRWTSVTGIMNDLRADVAAAATRMRVVFGTRSAMKQLVHSLEPAERVREMVACLFAGSKALLVLTDRRVLALRDDYSRYWMKATALDQITLVDYGPNVHDGLAVFTDVGRVAVRTMNRDDSDRFVAALTKTLPTIPVVTSRPRATASMNARLLAKAPADSEEHSQLNVTMAAPEHSSTQFFADNVSTAPAPAAATDQEVLYGVLTDLHARGLLSAEELAAKVAAVTATA